MNQGSKLAQYLLEIKAIKLQPNNPFRWSSGWNSPIYCDNRITLSYPHIRTFIQESLSDLIYEKYPEANAICGVATAGIAIGALVADKMNLPFSYCRPKPKEHGMQNQLEGFVEPNAKIVVLEDLISTGGSSIKVVEYLRAAGYNVVGMAAIFTYGFPLATNNFKEANCAIHCLGNFEEAIVEASKIGYIKPHELATLGDWRKNPSDWK